MIKKRIVISLILLVLWYLLYTNLQLIADFIVYDLFSLNKESHFAESLNFFIFETPKVLLLLSLIIFLVGVIRSFFSPEKTRKALEGKSLFTGNVLGALLGVLTPFCSCSAIPLFLGFVEAGIPIGVTFSFLIAAPMVNEIAIVLLVGMLGWKVTIIYILTGLTIAIFSGWLIGKLKLQRYVQDWVYQVKSNQQSLEENKTSWKERIDLGYSTVKEIVGKIWIYILVGIAVGAGAHGYIPENYMATLMGKDAWYSVPLSILIGVPLYSNAAGIIPIVSVLIEKGASLGTALAFMMSVIGLSLPEIIILKKVLKIPMLVIFVSIVAGGILIVGYMFNIFL
jgi:uncharacterized membrane protein YraQ (UPF0718 family)